MLREYTGRGPTKARTMINEDVVTVLLADTLTKGERRLAENGHAGRILEQGPAEEIFTHPREPRTQQFLERIIAAGRL